MKPNIIFLMIDSFSSNKFHGNEKTSHTPNLDSLISKGTYFPQTISVASTTVPSYSSVFTGLYPFQCTTKKDNVILFKKNLKTFLENFKEDGYNIFAKLPEMVSITGLSEIFPNCEIFDSFATLYDDIGNEIETKLEQLPQPWFYYIHLMDLHGSMNIKSKPKLENFLDKKFGKNSYEQMVSALDVWIGKIISKIDFKNTLLIITADHGSPVSEYDENMEEENQISDEKRNTTSKLSYRFGHKVVTYFPEFLTPMRKKLSKTYTEKRNKSISKNAESRVEKINSSDISPRTKRLLENAIMTTGNLYDEVCKIPLLFVGYSIPENKIISQQVKNIDIFPTLIEIVGQNPKKNIFGKSLIPLIKDMDVDEEPILLQTITNSEERIPKIGIRTSNFKYFRNDVKNTNTKFLFDLKSDPLEENNIADQNDSIIDKLEQQISLILEKGPIDDTKTEISQQEMDDAKDLLKKLGYI